MVIVRNRWTREVICEGETFAEAKAAAPKDLPGADLTDIRDDYWAVLDAAPYEVPALLAALRDGRVNGSVYQGECAYLKGTIANARHVGYSTLPGVLAPDVDSLAERFFLGIAEGDTPESNPIAKIVETWAVEWVERNKLAEPAPTPEST